MQSTAPEPGPISFTPQERGLSTARGSTKLNVLRCMLKTATALGEKVVIVSTSTQMLDAAAQVCGGLSLPTGRIDGSTAAALRQERVDQFNDTSPVTGELMKVHLPLLGSSALCHVTCFLDQGTHLPLFLISPFLFAFEERLWLARRCVICCWHNGCLQICCSTSPVNCSA